MDVPRSLPVGHLSKSSIDKYLKCPEQWRRRYLEGERTPGSVPLVLGKTIGAAVGAELQNRIDNPDTPMAIEDVLDLFSGEWDEAVSMDDIEWGGANPGRAKDEGARLTQFYEEAAAPFVNPVSVERKLEFRLGDAEWTVTGYIDYEEANGVVSDLKVKGRELKQPDANSALDPLLYLAARRAEGNPAPAFEFHQVIRPGKTTEPRVIRTTVRKDDKQLDRFLLRIAQISQEIAWRTETGNWSGPPPGSWWCSAKFCSYWSTCPMGGA